MRQEPDRPNVAALAWIGVAVLVVFAGCLIAVALFVKGRTVALAPTGEPPPPATIRQAQIGMVNQRPFGKEASNAEIQRRAHERLSSYGWVDRDAGIVHLPLDRALELVQSGARP
jgi:hypothetical protein